MTVPPLVKLTTAEEYLNKEIASTEKHDFVDDVVYARKGVDFTHNQISSNTHGLIGNFLKNQSCRIYGSDLKVHIKKVNGFVYPDLIIICSGPAFLERRTDVVSNPSVIIEVLSPDTERYDRGKKFMLYRQLETLQEYVLISSMEVLIEKFKKGTDGTWALKDYRTLDSLFSIETINYQTTLAEIYRDVVFDETGDSEDVSLKEERE